MTLTELLTFYKNTRQNCGYHCLRSSTYSSTGKEWRVQINKKSCPEKPADEAVIVQTCARQCSDRHWYTGKHMIRTRTMRYLQPSPAEALSTSTLTGVCSIQITGGTGLAFVCVTQAHIKKHEHAYPATLSTKTHQLRGAHASVKYE